MSNCEWRSFGHAWNWQPSRRFLWWTLRGYQWCYNCPARVRQSKEDARADQAARRGGGIPGYPL